MSQNNNNNPSYRPQEEEIDLREQLELYLRKWPWFILAVFVCVLAAFLYLRYATPVYNTVATIIIKDEENQGINTGLAEFAEMGMFGGMSTNSIENEIGILKSKRLLTNVAKNLNLNIRYFQEGTLRTSELYAHVPIKVQVLELDEKKLEDFGLFTVEILNEESFRIGNDEIDYDQKAAFGTTLEMPFGKIIVIPNFDAGSENLDAPILVSFGGIENAVANYRERIQVNLTDENSTLIQLSLEDPVREKAQDILNRLVYQYNQEAIEDKNQVSLNTAEFIEDRLEIISAELDSVETGKKEFKTLNRLTDIEAESELFLQNASEFRKEQLEVETQLELTNSMIEYLEDENNKGLLPANLGFSEESLVAAIQGYNQLVLERNRILAGSTERNPVIINMNDQIAQIRASVMQSLRNLKNSLLISQEDLREREVAISAQIAEVPATEKQFRSIQRQQNIKEALYLFLLQKREETSLALAATAPKAKIVDRAYSTTQPVEPKTKIVLLGSLIIGLLIPFTFIYTRNLLNNKVRNRSDIEKHTKKIPIVGEVPKVNRQQEELISAKDRSVLAESFRILHTNLQYLLVNAANKQGGNVIFVTSTIKGEGKTFTAFNLAVTLANSGKKVLIIGADLRNPQLQRYDDDARGQLGISDYLVNNNLKLQDLIHTSKLDANLYLLYSGSIPPNPSELWRLDKTTSMFKELEEQYDYIIVDTAPAMLVTDTFLISKYADLTLYMVRAGYTERKLLDFPIEAKQEGKLHHVAFVLNDVAAENFGYGKYKYGYGYAYGQDEVGFWKRLKTRF